MVQSTDAQRPLRRRARNFRNEEFANFLTHGSGLLLALAGAAVLFSAADRIYSDAMRVSCWVYGMALIAVYAASTLSHMFENPARRHFFRSLDQGMIFLFMAANFTPLAIVHLPYANRWSVLTVMWAIALVGFISKVFWGHRVESISITQYLVLAWLPITAIGPLLKSIPVDGAFLFAAGGAAYTTGIVFLALDSRVRYFHALWHLFVIAGSLCHFLVIVDYAIPIIA